MTKNNIIVVRDIVGPVPYWVMDEDLPKARSRFKRLTGKFPSKKASIIAFHGEDSELDSITINDLGDVSYSKQLIKIVLQEEQA